MARDEREVVPPKVPSTRSRRSGAAGVDGRPHPESDARPSPTPTDDALKRVVIENVRPEVDGGRFAAKAIVGRPFAVEADAFAEYEPIVTCVLRYRAEDDEWVEIGMSAEPDDHFRGGFTPTQLGTYQYAFEAWIDEFETWRRALIRKVEARQDVAVELKIGAALVSAASTRGSRRDSERLSAVAARLADGEKTKEGVRLALSDEIRRLMARYPDRSRATKYRELRLTVDPPKAEFSSWYELFPRSWAKQRGRHGTFRDLEDVLPYVAGMGFNVLYLPPIHPIGRTHRKGKNNALTAKADDPGSPWAIGSEEGGHKSVHPELGTVEDFRRFVKAAGKHGLDVALDIAFQCSPDHPYVKEHPEWFKLRPDRRIQFAENPPKKYEDIYPFNFETKDREGLWNELKSVFLYWAEQGVHIFRVDNPHTKPFAFWEWVIAEVKREAPDAIFLSEAFTRPRLMERLAKCGFTQSYTYFAWKTTKADLTEYFTRLTSPPLSDYFRPNAWPNTPDILTDYLVKGGRAAFIVRLVLAATLSASFGIYGPAFELREHTPVEPGSEEYLNSEKYELKRWNTGRADSLSPWIEQINAIRRENPALHSNERLRFHLVDNENIVAYSKRTGDSANVVIALVNLDPRKTHSGVIDLPLDEWGRRNNRWFVVEDLLGGETVRCSGQQLRVSLDPRTNPAAVFRLGGSGGGERRS
jgi:starch synthase (maltosyl-transferring)